ncbi:MAG: tRNA pseudouridine(55) synthase TruB [Thermodesulfobacteriota bacterium]
MEKSVKEGVLIIDKPQGITSHDVVLMARRSLKIKKIGHIGTLDPLATGVLPLCIGEATKLSPFLTKQVKEYIATIKFGEETDTLDSEGKITFKGEEIPLDKGKAVGVIQRFKGKLEQVPPIFSAIKKGGVPLYRLARKGVEVEVESREVEIQEIEVLNLSLPYMTFRVLCSAGTYIRALCRDMGRELKWRGHLTALRRIRSGSFSIKQSIPFEALQRNESSSIEKRLIPISSLLEDLPCLEVEKDIEEKVRRGWQPYLKTLNLPGLKVGGKVRFLSKDGRLISIAEIKDFETREKDLPLSTVRDKRGYSDLTFKLLRVFNY